MLFLLAAALRLNGIWWDEGQGFHPDERGLLLVAERLQPPESLPEALSPRSPLNPLWDREADAPRHFAYGHLPPMLLRALHSMASPYFSQSWTPDLQLTLLGRLLSVGADLGTLLLLWWMARPAGRAAALVAAGGWAVAWLPVQQAHFATVDSLLALAVTAALAAMGRVAGRGWRASLLAGVLVGLAASIKAPGGLLVIPLLLAHGGDRRRGLVALGGAALAFALTSPYALLAAPAFLAALLAEQGMASGRWLLPYTQQFRLALPLLYPLVQLGRWGIGWPLLALLVGGLGWGLTRGAGGAAAILTRPLLAWLLPYLALVLSGFAHFPRYLLPALPPLLLLGGAAVGRVPRPWRAGLVGLVLAPTLLWTVAQSHPYRMAHPWLQASAWIYERVPAGSTLLQERWDQGLPVPLELGGRYRSPAEYRLLDYDPYAPDDAAKIETLVGALGESDWLVLASPRGWRVLPPLADFPVMARAYRALFDGSAGFEVAAVWRVEGGLGGVVTVADDPFLPPGLQNSAAHAAWQAAQPAAHWWRPGPADESFSVYDRPVVLLLQKKRPLSEAALRRLLQPANGAAWFPPSAGFVVR